MNKKRTDNTARREAFFDVKKGLPRELAGVIFRVENIIQHVHYKTYKRYAKMQCALLN